MPAPNSGNSAEYLPTGSGYAPEAPLDEVCVYKHLGCESKSDQFLLLSGNAAQHVGADFVFPVLQKKLTQHDPEGLYTQTYFGWEERTPEEVDLREFRGCAWLLVERWTEKKIRTVLAALNKLLYHWGVGIGAIVEDGRQRDINRAIARAAIHGKSVLLCAFSSITDYIRQWWGHQFGDRSLWAYMAELKELCFLDYASVNGQGKKSRQWILNVPDLLLLAEACERRLLWLARQRETDLDPHGFEWDTLPTHHNYTLKLLFDAVFPGWGWGRIGDDTANEPTTYAETDQCNGLEYDQHWAALVQLRDAVLAGGWTDAIAAACDQLAARWGPAWGIEAVYERIVTRWDCFGGVA